MGEFDRIQQEIYSIVTDGAMAPKPDEDDKATMLLWYEAQISGLIEERDNFIKTRRRNYEAKV